MKRLVLIAASAALAAGTAWADPVAGVWKTQPGDDGAYGHVTIKPCGAKICGTLTAGFDAGGNKVSGPDIGRRMIWDMEAKGGGKYSGGKIWAPDRDKTYRSKMALSGATLQVSGCVGPICRGQKWTRIK
ncbi:DUF2147 domain-containing protein [Actibacterium sp. 188UL27-1]|uniref:DUF2147 domain-containing protein n=1 Tax=Actibacterium sp. 188UL27-1 TaxID=2786961 RepID=UPI00195AA394|nr:DUF2147 domain-containing protein [Actibacterium sp. 188UL27-1]MBM7069254.1 DUF2147 domain-containing protein [Actibacterium sp. 188UL27-1]